MTQKQIGSLSISKGYTSKSFLSCSLKTYVLLVIAKSQILNTFNFLVIYFQSLLFWNKSEYIQQVSTVFFLSKQSLYELRACKLKKLRMKNVQELVLHVEAVIYLLLHNLHDCTFKP